MAKNRYLRSAYEHDFDIQRPYKGWPRLPPGQRAYPVFRSKCTGALVAAPLGWEHQHRSVKLPGVSAPRKQHVNYKSLYPQTDPKGRPLFISECTGAVVSFSKTKKKRYYWPRESVRPIHVPVRRMAAAAVTTTTNPFPDRARSINHRRPGLVTTTGNPYPRGWKHLR